MKNQLNEFFDRIQFVSGKLHEIGQKEMPAIPGNIVDTEKKPGGISASQFRKDFLEKFSVKLSKASPSELQKIESIFEMLLDKAINNQLDVVLDQFKKFLETRTKNLK
jgi:hypothetical protein